MEKWHNVGNGKEKIPLQICDIILPTAHIQTKQGYVSGFHLRLFSPPLTLSSSLPPLFLFLSLEKVGGGLERWQNSRSFEVCPIPALNSAPQLLWFETVRLSVSFSLNHFLPSLRTPLSTHLLSVTLSLPCSAAFLWEVLEKPAKGLYQEDNDQKSSSHFTFHTELIHFSSKTNRVEYIYFSSG